MKSRELEPKNSYEEKISLLKNCDGIVIVNENK